MHVPEDVRAGIDVTALTPVHVHRSLPKPSRQVELGG
jgi:hypothetical protein